MVEKWRTEQIRSLQKQEISTPLRVSVYRASCWAYTLTGIWYLWAMPSMPVVCRSTYFMSGEAFGSLLVLQGFFSYMNDAVCTFGRYGYFSWATWEKLDRALAWTLMINVVSCALVWGKGESGGAEGARARLTVSTALVASCALAYPMSKWHEQSGRMSSFLLWHSIWHIVPNVLAMLWFALLMDPSPLPPTLLHLIIGSR